MKYVLATALILSSLSAFAAEIVCSGVKDGREVSFSITQNENGDYTSMSTSLDGVEYAKFTQADMRVSQHVYGTMISADINPYSGDGVLILFNTPTIQGTRGVPLGWINDYRNRTVIRGVELNMNCGDAI